MALHVGIVQYVIYKYMQISSTCRDLFNQVVAHQSLEETHIFGLAIAQGKIKFLLGSVF